MPTVFPSATEADELLVGPESVTWQRVSDVRLNLVMIYALLLQVAHPTVGAGVQDYSEFEQEPWARLWRTLDYVTVLVYGGQRAIPTGRALREGHRRFRGVRGDGRRYSALEPDAFAWVHATLISAYAVGHAHFGRPMTLVETTRFYDEYRGLGRLIGVRDGDLPRTWSGFCGYFERMTRRELVQTPAVDRVLGALRRVPPPAGLIPELLWPAVRIPAAEAMRLGGVGPMSPQLRARLGIPWTRRDELAFRALGLACRRLDPVMPHGLKVTGPLQLRLR